MDPACFHIAGLALHRGTLFTGCSFGRLPVPHQRVVVPANACAMKLDFNPPHPRP